MKKNGKEMIEKYEQALDLQTSLKALSYLRKRVAPQIDGCYDINKIRKAFHAFFQQEIDEKYLAEWGVVYANLIRENYPLKERRDIAYNEIANSLETIENGLSPIYAFAEIELHNEVVEGKRGADYPLATDCEIFYVDLYEEHEEYEEDEDANNGWGSDVDILSIDHRRKTFFISRGDTIMNTDGDDLLGNPYDSCSVSRIVFESLCKGMATTGYTEIK